MAITLEKIEAAQTRISEMIEQFKKQPTVHAIPAVVISLAPGERYAGAILRDDGTVDYHLIKLSGEASSKMNWADAVAYAEGRGGVAPSLRDLALMRTHLRSEFKDEAYWSGETHKGDSSFAWCQYFHYGNQSSLHKGAALRAVAVRRFIPSVL